jgi:hypothetical protein
MEVDFEIHETGEMLLSQEKKSGSTASLTFQIQSEPEHAIEIRIF